MIRTHFNSFTSLNLKQSQKVTFLYYAKLFLTILMSRFNLM